MNKREVLAVLWVLYFGAWAGLGLVLGGPYENAAFLLASVLYAVGYFQWTLR